jgi:hypothetical protein
MGRLSPLFSADQKAAVIGAYEGGLTAREVAAAAAAGELLDEPFEIAVSTINDLVMRYRRTERVEDGTAEDAERVRAIAQKTIARVEALEAPTAKDLSALEGAIRVVRKTERVAPRPPPKESKRDENGRTRLELLVLESVAAVRAVAEGEPCPCHLPFHDDATTTCYHCLQAIKRHDSPPPLYVLAGQLESAEVVLEREAAREPAFAEALAHVRRIEEDAPAADGQV